MGHTSLSTDLWNAKRSKVVFFTSLKCIYIVKSTAQGPRSEPFSCGRPRLCKKTRLRRDVGFARNIRLFACQPQGPFSGDGEVFTVDIVPRPSGPFWFIRDGRRKIEARAPGSEGSRCVWILRSSPSVLGGQQNFTAARAESDLLWLSMRALYFDLTALLRGIAKVFVTECKNSRSGVRFGVS